MNFSEHIDILPPLNSFRKPEGYLWFLFRQNFFAVCIVSACLRKTKLRINTSPPRHHIFLWTAPCTAAQQACTEHSHCQRKQQSVLSSALYFISCFIFDSVSLFHSGNLLHILILSVTLLLLFTLFTPFTATCSFRSIPLNFHVIRLLTAIPESLRSHLHHFP